MKIHFIGIGGIGVSALAQYYLEKGHEVSGSDLVMSDITDFLAKKGVKIFQGNSESHVASNLDLVVYSPAIKYNNAEFRKARDTGAKLQSYPEALGDLTKEFYTIAISGSHGKSTTTAMTALSLIKAGLNPTVIVGTKLKEFGDSNFRMGGFPDENVMRNLKIEKFKNSKILIIEACEYDSSFLNYQPKIIVVTNVDKEHLDYFKNFNNVKKAFKDFIARLPADGFLVFNKDDKATAAVIPAKAGIQSKSTNPGFRVPTSPSASTGRGKPGMTSVSYSLEQKEANKIKKLLKVPGEHNVSNALAVLAVARILEISDKTTFKALSEFKGTWRRFEEIEPKIEKFKNLKIISDYGHHPNEIMATLKATREKFPKKQIWCVFQPHQYQRTYYLFDDFVKVFREAEIDKIIITDIYDVAGRETKEINSEVSSEKLVKKINKKHISYSPAGSVEGFIKENIKSKDVLIIMGAGDIYKLAEKF